MAGITKDGTLFVGEQSAARLTCEHNLPRHKDEQDNSGFDHPVNQPWKQLRFIAETEKVLFSKHDSFEFNYLFLYSALQCHSKSQSTFSIKVVQNNTDDLEIKQTC